ncbi:MAG: DUF4386 family protein [Anaerolineae bacterium]
MTTTKTFAASAKQSQPSDWAPLYRAAAIAALITLALILLDTMISAAAGGGEAAPGSLSAVEWFAVFNSQPLRAMRDLGVLNIVNSILSIPVFIALYVLHQRDQRPLAGLAIILFLFGSAIYIANNTVLPMLALSGQYAAAISESQRLALAAAGEAMLARGADFTPGSLVGFVLPSLANILMAVVVLRGAVFGKAAGYVGVAGFTLLLAFTIWVTLVPAALDTALLVLAFPGGIAVLAWNIIIVRRLFQVARHDH